MNNITNKILNMNRCALQIIGHKLNMSPAVLQIQNRFYSRPTSFPDYFQNPIFRKGDQAKLIENDELSKIATVPVKPPAAYETSSVYHDPLVKMNTINDKENVDRTFKKCCPFKTEDPIFFSMGITARDLSILHFCSKVINHVMEMGKKQLARSLVEKAFENIKRIQIERYHLASTSEEKAKIELNPKEVLHRAVENCKPLLQLLPIKRGGITYQVPSPITEKRSLFLAIKWLLEATNDKERTVHFPDQFAWELLDAANNTGKVVKRKQDLHRQCEANRAYAHYRWQS